MATIDMNNLAACLAALSSDELAQLDIALREKRRLLSCGFGIADVRGHIPDDERNVLTDEQIWEFLQENEDEIEERAGGAAGEVISENLQAWCENNNIPWYDGDEEEDELAQDFLVNKEYGL